MGRRDRAQGRGRYQEDLITGIVGLESSGLCARALQRVPASPGDPRRRAGGELYLRASITRNSPEQSRRENWWYYSQGGPGVYQGDVHFYSNDWDGREDISASTPTAAKVALLTGDTTIPAPRR
jgi:hypothetical protein